MSLFMLYVAHNLCLDHTNYHPVSFQCLPSFIHPCHSSPACTYVCSVLLRLEKQGGQAAGAVHSSGDEGPVWPEGAEEWLAQNQTLSPRWVGGWLCKIAASFCMFFFLVLDPGHVHSVSVMHNFSLVRPLVIVIPVLHLFQSNMSILFLLHCRTNVLNMP